MRALLAIEEGSEMNARMPYLRVVGGGRPRREIGDATLNHALTCRESWARELTWARFAPTVLGAMSRALGPDSTPDWLVHRLFIELFERSQRGGIRRTLKSQVYSLVVELLTRELRVRAVRRWFRGSPPQVEDARRWPLVGRAGAVLSRLYAQLDRLGPAERVLFSLHEFEGMSVPELAEIYGVSSRRIERRLTRVVAKLEHWIEGDLLLCEHVNEQRRPRPDLQEGA